MIVVIGHAVMDEDGKTDGPIPGDQTGKEIAMRNWYARTGGWGIYLEPTDAAMADRAASYMEQICADSAFGYSQKNRWAGYKSIEKNGGIVAGAKGDFDCSSLCIACYILAGLDHKPSGYTGSMATSLMATGKFIKHTEPEYLSSDAYAVRGGLYIAPGKHVSMALCRGDEAGQAVQTVTEDHSGEADNIQLPYVLILGNVRVRSGPGTTYPKLFTAKKGDKFPFYEAGEAANGEKWFAINCFNKGDGWVSGKKAYTRLVT